MLDLSVKCPYCEKKHDPSRGVDRPIICWSHEGPFMSEDSNNPIEVDCLCGKTFIWDACITAVEVKAIKIEEEEEN